MASGLCWEASAWRASRRSAGPALAFQSPPGSGVSTRPSARMTALIAAPGGALTPPGRQRCRAARAGRPRLSAGAAGPDARLCAALPAEMYENATEVLRVLLYPVVE